MDSYMDLDKETTNINKYKNIFIRNKKNRMNKQNHLENTRVEL